MREEWFDKFIRLQANQEELLDEAKKLCDAVDHAVKSNRSVWSWLLDSFSTQPLREIIRLIEGENDEQEAT